ncbi:MAG: hypothetical protein IH831_00950, partial [Planctomycetes bacterium]|nr:hypothetical protein [Planctomycetota bacterium]
MLSHWPIRTKLKLGLGRLLVTVLALFSSAYYGLYAYRSLVKGLSARSAELPLASQVLQHVSDLRVILSQAKERLEFPAAVEAISSATNELEYEIAYPWNAQLLRERYREELLDLVDAIDQYSRQLDCNGVESDPRLGDDTHERQTLAKIFEVLGRIGAERYHSELEEGWLLDQSRIGVLQEEVEQLGQLAAELPRHLHNRLKELAFD